MYPNTTKTIYDESIDNTVLNFSTVESGKLSLCDQEQNRMPNVTPFQHSTGSPSRAIGEERELRTILIEKENVKLSLFADDSIISIVLRLEKKTLKTVSYVKLWDTKSESKNHLYFCMLITIY